MPHDRRLEADNTRKDSLVVLLVEDHRDTREMYAERLHHAGFTVIEVSSAERALRVLGPVTPDVIVTDLSMPGIGGLEFLRRLRADSATPAIPAIAIAASTDSTRDKALAAGACAFIPKPCTPDDLVLAVKQIVGGERHAGG